VKKSRIKRCAECGAELREGVGSCPLCGTDGDAPVADPWDKALVEIDRYHSNVRQLREQLKKLRDDHPEAV
jgi:RNA polymerase subunit RPABC4/transcription elongation factor Spt4